MISMFLQGVHCRVTLPKFCQGRPHSSGGAGVRAHESSRCCGGLSHKSQSRTETTLVTSGGVSGLKRNQIFEIKPNIFTRVTGLDVISLSAGAKGAKLTNHCCHEHISLCRFIASPPSPASLCTHHGYIPVLTSDPTDPLICYINNLF